MISTYEKIEGFVHNNRCIDGSVTGCNKCVGYCNFDEHPGFLTAKLRKEHNCVKKGCDYYSVKEKNKRTSIHIKRILQARFSILPDKKLLILMA